MAKMGLQFGLYSGSGGDSDSSKFGVFKRRFRWLFEVPSVCAGNIYTLPPSQSARPSLSFKETEARHLTETVYYPVRPDWKPVQLVLYDLLKKRGNNTFHPVWIWLQKLYNPGMNAPSTTPGASGKLWSTATENNFITQADLKMLDGCGTVIEHWVFENVWPQVTDFGRLDMSNSEIMTCDLTLRYARAYMKEVILN